MSEIEVNAGRIRVSQVFQHRPYQSMTLDATVEVALHDAEAPEVIASAVKSIQEGFGLALFEVLKRYNENKTDETLQAELNAIIPPALKITLKDNEFIMDALLLAARRKLDAK